MKPLESFKSEAKNNSWSHAYLLVGDNDSLVEEIIDYIVSENEIAKSDIVKVTPGESSNKSGEIKVEEIRELLKRINVSPQGKRHLAIIYGCEKLNASSGNILLKNLEEPAGNVIFVLVAQRDAILPTIKSRCRVVNLSGDFAKTDEPSGELMYIPDLKKGFFAASLKIEEVVKENQSEALLSELRKNLRQKMLSEKDKKYAYGLELVEEAKNKIGANANPRLALECLVLALEGII